ncbi:WAP four-disulfide core domain 2-like [Brachionus plicatilis]|uniref:WAP four-disulfide core domain 2-like n=1 Tax=Brachionus plicatilis TaxID=10195 RepID=A0A3M7SCT0_BRAPC|nr:WAP four-disulfide core domain 2-like [Brachionus plicatilis]
MKNTDLTHYFLIEKLHLILLFGMNVNSHTKIPNCMKIHNAKIGVLSCIQLSIQKCCICVFAIFLFIKRVDMLKNGTCPTYASDLITTCDVLCSSDFDCPNLQKCCSVACSIRCVDPVLKKPGLCPMIKLKFPINSNLQNCSSDQDCKGKQKCCPNWNGEMSCSDPFRKCSFFKWWRNDLNT